MQYAYLRLIDVVQFYSRKTHKPTSDVALGCSKFQSHHFGANVIENSFLVKPPFGADCTFISRTDAQHISIIICVMIYIHFYLLSYHFKFPIFCSFSYTVRTLRPPLPHPRPHSIRYFSPSKFHTQNHFHHGKLQYYECECDCVL